MQLPKWAFVGVLVAGVGAIFAAAKGGISGVLPIKTLSLNRGDSSMKKLCIDPGHGLNNTGNGRYDSGAVSGAYQEASIVMSWAQTGKYVLEREFGLSVFLTRDNAQDDAPLGKRQAAANAAGCSHYLSLHCNAAGATATGTETLYRDGNDLSFARQVQALAVAALDRPNRGVKNERASQHAQLAVFDFRGPAALLELGFVTNASDRARLTDMKARLEFWQAFGRTFAAGGQA